ncbi:MAG: FAD-dependent monooxygenase [Acuticoccus sp.]
MILVVGAGIAGLSAALALAPFGDVVVVERRSDAAANAGAGIQLSPNAIKALAAIGARETVAARASAPAGLTIRAAGRPAPLTRLDYGAMDATFGAPYLTASRADLAAGLLAAVAAQPAITLRYDCALEALEAAPGGGWRAAGLDATPDFVVVADGVGSPLRGQLIGDAPRATPFVAWRGSAADEGSADTELTMATGCHLVRYALANRRDNIVFITKGARHPATITAGPMAAPLAAVTDWTPWPIRVRPRARFALDRGVLIGDAAHAMPPFLAQGGAMAIEDAAVLGAMVTRHGLGATAAVAYEGERQARINRLAAQTGRQGGIYHLPVPLSLPRDMAMRRLGAAGILSRVGWIYGWQPPAAR